MRSVPSKQQWENNLNWAKLDKLNIRSSIKVRDYIPIIFWHACEGETCPNILVKVIITFKYIVRWRKLLHYVRTQLLTYVQQLCCKRYLIFLLSAVSECVLRCFSWTDCVLFYGSSNSIPFSSPNTKMT